MSVHTKMRIYHRYLGFFLAGIMAIYALSGIVLILRDTDFLKQTKKIERKLEAGLTAEAVGKETRMRDLKFTDSANGVYQFKNGSYNAQTGALSYTVKELPRIMSRLTQLHKANSKDPLFFLNIFFGVSLFFFVVSSFWMFTPKSSIFKKGLVFAGAGIALVLIMLFV